MKYNRKKSASKTKEIALCGVISALAMAVLFFSSAIGVGTYAGPILAIMMTIPVVCEYKEKAFLMVYFAISILCLLFSMDPQMTLVYLAFGWYPALQPKIYRIQNAVIRTVLIGISYTIVMRLLVQLAVFFFGLDLVLAKTTMLGQILWGIGLLMFLFLDLIFLQLRVLWSKKIRSVLIF